MLFARMSTLRRKPSTCLLSPASIPLRVVPTNGTTRVRVGSYSVSLGQSIAIPLNAQQQTRHDHHGRPVPQADGLREVSVRRSGGQKTKSDAQESGPIDASMN